MSTSADPNFYGITVPQVFAFLLTIAAAYSSARWASAESRKQFSRKMEDDERAAAAELITQLTRFALDCDKKKIDLSRYMSSEGHEGEDGSVDSVAFPAGTSLQCSRLRTQDNRARH
ncbi:hypothetical protein ABIF74_004472 [Bradyrhizobium japonicum]